mgnify:CR=1 FL=1
MFTGIIEEVGTINRITGGTGSTGAKLVINAQTVLQNTKIGDSIAVNGVCLTVTDLTNTSFTADVMPETLRRSNLGALKSGSRVNLERAMPADGRFGGHIVSGHIDSTGVICNFTDEGNAIWVQINCAAEILSLIVEKGSITIDGISLTVAYVDEKSFKVSVIPHTASQTSLTGKKTGDVVNLENDIVAKYVQKLLGTAVPQKNGAGSTGITEEFLRENGF